MLRRNIFILLSVAAVGLLTAIAQPPGGRGRRGGGEASLKQPFRGITAGGEIEEGLFKVKSTGVSTGPVVNAANAFLAGLTEDQSLKTMFPVDDIEWRSWDNRHFYKRRGVGFDEMNEQQRELAFGLL